MNTNRHSIATHSIVSLTAELCERDSARVYKDKDAP